MALGGGTWQFQNKILPGTYINFASKVRAEADISERGYATMALPFNWGPENTIFPVTAEDFQERVCRFSAMTTRQTNWPDFAICLLTRKLFIFTACLTMR